MNYPQFATRAPAAIGRPDGFFTEALASEEMRSGAMKSAGRTGRRVPRRFFQSIDVLLKNSALGAKPEDETEQKCAIAHLDIFTALSHLRALPHLVMRINERPFHLGS